MKAFKCPLPWNHLSVEPNGNVYSCCNAVAFPPLGSVQNETLDEIWNGDNLKKLRREFNNEIIPTQCLQCVRDEKNKNLSIRQISLGKFGEINTSEDSPPYIGLRLDNVCNLSCRICSSGLSTSWYNDERALNLNPPDKVIRAFSDDSWKGFLESNLLNSQILYFAGGEPLISNKLQRILSMLVSNKKTNIELIINTNFSFELERLKSVLPLIDKFKNVNLDLSLDGIHQRGEYMRHGQDWKIVETNIHFTRKNHPNIKLKLSPTISIFNVLHLPEYVEYMITHLGFSPNEIKFSVLTEPQHYSMNLLTIDLKCKAVSQLKSLIKYLLINYDLEIASVLIVQVNGIIATLNNNNASSLHSEKFQSITTALDKIRNDNFISVFPELKRLLK